MKRVQLEWEAYPSGESASLRIGLTGFYATVRPKTATYGWEIGEWVGEGQDDIAMGDSMTLEGAKLAAEIAMFRDVVADLPSQFAGLNAVMALVVE